MKEKQFKATLDAVFTCRCGVVVKGLDWRIARSHAGDWMGICVVGCSACQWLHVAAAGNTNESHGEAQALRSKLLKVFGK